MLVLFLLLVECWLHFLQSRLVGDISWFDLLQPCLFPLWNHYGFVFLIHQVSVHSLKFLLVNGAWLHVFQLRFQFFVEAHQSCDFLERLFILYWEPSLTLTAVVLLWLLAADLLQFLPQSHILSFKLMCMFMFGLLLLGEKSLKVLVGYLKLLVLSL